MAVRSWNFDALALSRLFFPFASTWRVSGKKKGTENEKEETAKEEQKIKTSSNARPLRSPGLMMRVVVASGQEVPGSQSDNPQPLHKIIEFCGPGT